MADPGGVRIGDAERQRVVDMLRRHTSEGRLTLDEFSERAGQVYAAQTQSELAAVLVDLPGDLHPPATATTAPGGVADLPRRRRFIGVMSSAVARGPWRAPPEIRAFSFWGSVYIDLTSAAIESPVVDIRAVAIMGSVTVRVPEGIPVDIDGFVVMGGTNNMVRSTAPIPGAPVVRVRAYGLWGGVTVRNPRKKKGLRDALRQQREQVDVHGIVTDALDMARTSIDRALAGPTTDDRIPEMPGDRRRERAERHKPRHRGPRLPSLVVPPMPPGADRNVNLNLNANGAARTNGATGDGAGDGTASRIPPGTLTILVSDIVGSTQLAEKLGDQGWVEVLDRHNAIVRRHVEEHGGVEVKNQGDGFLIVFPSARGAVLAAIAIQRSIADFRHDNPDVTILLRLGLHTGEVVATGDDIFGQNVVVATRIADVCEPGGIVVSGLTRDLTASASDLGFEPGTDVDLKGISAPYRVHRVLL
jgi:class 3 adenylate cyclase